MDVGNPSNMERIRALYPTVAAIREQLSADSVDDATIRSRIKEDFMNFAREWCPHTATAAELAKAAAHGVEEVAVHGPRAGHDLARAGHHRHGHLDQLQDLRAAELHLLDGTHRRAPYRRGSLTSPAE